MLLANLEWAQGWVLIIGAIFLGVTNILQILQGLRAAKKVKEVKEDLAEVRTNTNGMTERLIRMASAENYQRGLADGQAKETALNRKNAVELVQAVKASVPVAQPVTEHDLESLH